MLSASPACEKPLASAPTMPSSLTQRVKFGGRGDRVLHRECGEGGKPVRSFAHLRRRGSRWPCFAMSLIFSSQGSPESAGALSDRIIISIPCLSISPNASPGVEQAVTQFFPDVSNRNTLANRTAFVRWRSVPQARSCLACWFPDFGRHHATPLRDLSALQHGRQKRTPAGRLRSTYISTAIEIILDGSQLFQ